MKSLVFVFAMTSILAFADKGPSSGGGGDVVILPNDQVVLADPFLNHDADQPRGLPSERSLNPKIIDAAKKYLRAVADLMNQEESLYTTLQELTVRSDYLEFIAVRNTEELNDNCASGGKKNYTLPNGAKVQQVACTHENKTYLVEPIFIKLSLRDQVLLLMHERLTTLTDAAGSRNYSAIANFTSGLNTFLDIFKEQRKNTFRQLTDAEQKRITALYSAIKELELRDSDIPDDAFNWHAHSLGGGRVNDNVEIPANTTVSLGSNIGEGSTIEENVKIVRSDVWATKLGANSQVIDSILSEGSNLGANSLVRNSMAHNLTVKGRAEIIESIIEAYKTSYWNKNFNPITVNGSFSADNFNISLKKDKNVIAPNQVLANGEVDQFDEKSKWLVGASDPITDLVINYEEKSPNKTLYYKVGELPVFTINGGSLKVDSKFTSRRTGIIERGWETQVSYYAFNLSYNPRLNVPRDKNVYVLSKNGKIEPAAYSGFIRIDANHSINDWYVSYTYARIKEAAQKQGWNVYSRYLGESTIALIAPGFENDPE